MDGPYLCHPNVIFTFGDKIKKNPSFKAFFSFVCRRIKLVLKNHKKFFLALNVPSLANYKTIVR